MQKKKKCADICVFSLIISPAFFRIFEQQHCDNFYGQSDAMNVHLLPDHGPIFMNNYYQLTIHFFIFFVSLFIIFFLSVLRLFISFLNARRSQIYANGRCDLVRKMCKNMDSSIDGRQNVCRIKQIENASVGTHRANHCASTTSRK